MIQTSQTSSEQSARLSADHSSTSTTVSLPALRGKSGSHDVSVLPLKIDREDHLLAQAPPTQTNIVKAKFESPPRGRAIQSLPPARQSCRCSCASRPGKDKDKDKESRRGEQKDTQTIKNINTSENKHPKRAFTSAEQRENSRSLFCSLKWSSPISIRRAKSTSLQHSAYYYSRSRCCVFDCDTWTDSRNTLHPICENRWMPTRTWIRSRLGPHCPGWTRGGGQGARLARLPAGAAELAAATVGEHAACQDRRDMTGRRDCHTGAAAACENAHTLGP